MKFNLLHLLQCILFCQGALASQGGLSEKIVKLEENKHFAQEEGSSNGDSDEEEEEVHCKDENPLEAYHSIVKVGEGAFGKVYRAERHITQPDGSQMREIVALKEISLEENDELLVYDEYRLHSRLRHKNIVQVFGCYRAMKIAEEGDLDDTFWIEMEFIDGVSLQDLVEKAEKIHIASIFQILKPMLSALSHLHEEKILHRDIKPDNLMISREGELKLIDLGLAMKIFPDLKPNLTVGTPRYMAPEVCCPSDDGYDKGCDIWGLGATVYFVCEGAEPFAQMEEKEIEEYMERCCSNPSEFKPLTTTGAKLNLKDLTLSLKDVQDILDKTTQFNPNDRPYPECVIPKELTWDESNEQRVLGELVEMAQAKLSLKKQPKEVIGDNICIHVDPLKYYGDLKEVGSGGYGTVYRAKRLYLQEGESQEFVALKKVNITNERRRMRTLSEFSIQKRLSHENIVKVYDCYLTEEISDEGNEFGIIWISMEYINGVTLHDLIRPKAPMPIDIMLYIFKSVLAAVDYLHSNNVIHRDIKGKNILISVDGKIKLADFGLSTEFIPTNKPTSEVGTAHFKAPEVFYPKGGYDSKCDIWSLAALLYMMCEADHLFDKLADDKEIKKQLYPYMKNSSESFSRELMGANLAMGEKGEKLGGLRKIFSEMLQLDPKLRSTAKELYSNDVMECNELGAQNSLKALIEVLYPSLNPSDDRNTRSLESDPLIGDGTPG